MRRSLIALFLACLTISVLGVGIRKLLDAKQVSGYGLNSVVLLTTKETSGEGLLAEVRNLHLKGVEEVIWEGSHNDSFVDTAAEILEGALALVVVTLTVYWLHKFWLHKLHCRWP